MRLLLTALLVLALATPAMAAFNGPGGGPAPAAPSQGGPGFSGPGGFSGPQSRGVNKAADVARAYDDTPVVLVGNLVEQVGHERYVFRDGSGTVIVKIDHEDFRGQNVTPQTRVRVVGEVDYEHTHKEVDVDFIEIVR